MSRYSAVTSRNGAEMSQNGAEMSRNGADITQKGSNSLKDGADSSGDLTDLTYVPQHPLPPEIGALPRDDTVCKFCGVSYLILNEIKKLEERLKQTLMEIERLKGVDEKLEEEKR